MKKTNAGPSGKSALRRQAEEDVKKNEPAAAPSDPGADIQKLLQELQIHQVEIELQNEELVRSRNETDSLLEKFTDIYDFSPIGHFTLSPAGTILQVNLTGAGILGVERPA